ncbi:cytochrome P450 [Ekhidna sp.]|uniref:cytochrome P450 n=1 Tax=Ekhidna sp. TaxID=2608089 RepID=UPI003CCC16A8
MTVADLWKPTSRDFIHNPYHAYREIRKTHDVFRANTGDYVVLGYQECRHILQDPSFGTGLRLSWVEKMANESSKRGQDLSHLIDSVAGMLVQINPPEQQVIKSDMAKSWPGTAELKKVSEEIITVAINELPPQFDAIESICRKVPLNVISTLLGLPKEETKKYAIDGINLVQILGPYLSYRDILTIGESSKRLQSFIQENILAEGYSPTKLTNLLIQKYPETEVINLLLFIFIAGYETTSSLLTLCIYHLIKNKGYRSRIEKYGVKSFINEILRLHSPVQITGRTNNREIELDGQTIPKNAALTVCIAAANVDPAHFENPDELIWDRKKHEHLSFGYGLHHCLGSQLAEIEAEVLIEKLLPILDRLSIEKEPVLRDQYTIKSYQSFNLCLK